MPHLGRYIPDRLLPGPDRPDTVYASFIVIGRDMEAWGILRGAVTSEFSQALYNVALRDKHHGRED